MRPAALLITGAIALFTLLLMLFAFDTSFTGRATTGTVVNISNSSPATCALELAAGYNTISVPCITTAEAIGTILNGSEYVAAYQYVPGGGDVWKVHNPNLPAYVVSDLQFLSRRGGYGVLMDAQKTITISGFEVASTNVPLAPGWNLVGYPAFTIRNASDAFQQIDNFTAARTFNTTQQAYVEYLNPGGGTLVYVVPGQGYWINATQGTTWTVNS